LPVSRLWGAGPKTQKRLTDLGFETIGDVAAADPEFLDQSLGSVGAHFFELANARDPRRVARRRGAKSLGSDRTLAHDVARRADICIHLRRSADTVGRRLRRKGYLAGGVRVKLKTSNFQLLTRQRRLHDPTDVADALYRAGVELLDEFDSRGPFRLVGLAAYELTRDEQAAQEDLFEQGDRTRQRRLEETIDALSERFGAGAVQRARELAESGGPRLAANLDFLDASEQAPARSRDRGRSRDRRRDRGQDD
jgi:DNA polymerase-4